MTIRWSENTHKQTGAFAVFFSSRRRHHRSAWEMASASILLPFFSLSFVSLSLFGALFHSKDLSVTSLLLCFSHLTALVECWVLLCNYFLFLFLLLVRILLRVFHGLVGYRRRFPTTRCCVWTGKKRRRISSSPFAWALATDNYLLIKILVDVLFSFVCLFLALI